MKLYKCTKCGYVYDPKKGDIDHGITPGTSFENLPEDWTCPICKAGKHVFIPGPEID
jgi:rubredoxin